MMDDAAYAKGEKVDGDLDALIDRAHAKRAGNNEPDITAMLNERAEKKRRRRRRENIGEWQAFHEQLADNMRREAERQQAKADALRDAPETSL